MAATTDANGQVAKEETKTEVEEAEESEEEETTKGNEKADDAAVPAPSVTAAKEIKKWPGWPGDNVFRLVVPVIKVGSIIGKKGELIKRICEETRAKVRILDGVVGTTDRVVLIFGKEEPEAEISPAMEAVLRVFKRISEIGSDGTSQASTPATCSVRLLAPSNQAIHLIGKQGSSIKSIQAITDAIIRVLTADELPYYAGAEERVVDIHGEYLKVLKALEAVLGHLRKFLVDRSVVPLFEKNPNASPAPPAQPEAQAQDKLYRPMGLGRSSVSALVARVTQTMQIPLTYAEDIIGIGGANVAYIRRTSGAVLTVQESGGSRDEITVEIKGTSMQVQIAQQIIQDFIEGHVEPAESRYGSLLSSGYQMSVYPSSSLAYGSYRF